MSQKRGKHLKTLSTKYNSYSFRYYCKLLNEKLKEIEGMYIEIFITVKRIFILVILMRLSVEKKHGKFRPKIKL